MLIKSGCSKVTDGKCSYGWKNFKMNSTNRKYNYTVSLDYYNTYCSISINDDGELSPIFLNQESCIYVHQ